MSLTRIVEKEKISEIKFTRGYAVKTQPKYQAQSNGLFCEQYLEKPVISGDYKMALSPTACTIKGVPVIDDF